MTTIRRIGKGLFTSLFFLSICSFCSGYEKQLILQLPGPASQIKNNIVSSESKLFQLSPTGPVEIATTDEEYALIANLATLDWTLLLDEEIAVLGQNQNEQIVTSGWDERLGIIENTPGATWNPIGQTPCHGSVVINASPVLYALCGSELFQSTNTGKTWSPLLSNLNLGTVTTATLYDGMLYVGTKSQGVWRINPGQSEVVNVSFGLEAPPGYKEIRSLWPLLSGIYAVTPDAVYVLSLFSPIWIEKSINFPLHPYLTAEIDQVSVLAEAECGHVIAATGHLGLWKYTDDVLGHYTGWNPLPNWRLPLSPGSSVFFEPITSIQVGETPNVITVTTKRQGIYQSTDSGLHFERLPLGAIEGDIDKILVLSSSEVILLSQWHGLLFGNPSDNTSFTPIFPLEQNVPFLIDGNADRWIIRDVAWDGTYLWVGTKNGELLKGSRNGNNWIWSSVDIPWDYGMPAFSITDLSLWSTGLTASSPWGGTQHLSSLGTWSDISQGLPGTNYLDLRFHESIVNIIGGSTSADKSQPIVALAESKGVYLRDGSSSSWSSLPTNYPAYGNVLYFTCITEGSAQTGEVLVGTIGAGVLIIPLDGTQPIQATGLPLQFPDETRIAKITALTLRPDLRQVVYAGVENHGLYRSVDSGRSFTLVDDSLKAIKDIVFLSPNDLLVANKGSLYRVTDTLELADGTVSWVSVQPDWDIPGGLYPHTLMASVANVGTENLTGGTLHFILLSQGSETELTIQAINGLQVGEHKTFMADQINIPAWGSENTIIARVSSFDQTDTNPTNNERGTPFYTYYEYDLGITAFELTPAPPRYVGDLLTAHIEVKNVGLQPLQDANLSLLVDWVNEVDSLQCGPLAIAKSKTFELQWDTTGFPAGDHSVRVLLSNFDPRDDGIDNNGQHLTVRLSLRTVDISIHDGTAHGDGIAPGQNITIDAQVTNSGQEAITDVTIGLEARQGATTINIGDIAIGPLALEQTVPVSHPWTVTGLSYGPANLSIRAASSIPPLTGDPSDDEFIIPVEVVGERDLKAVLVRSIPPGGLASLAHTVELHIKNVGFQTITSSIYRIWYIDPVTAQEVDIQLGSIGPLAPLEETNIGPFPWNTPSIPNGSIVQLHGAILSTTPPEDNTTNNQTSASVSFTLFTDISVAAGLYPDRQTFGNAWADYDQDGHVDFIVVQCSDHLGEDVLYKGHGDLTFTDVTEEAGINLATWPGWWCVDTPCFGDYDSDGDWDLVIAGWDMWSENGGLALFTNLGNGTFGRTNLPHNKADNVRWFDCDKDGLLDMYVSGENAPNMLNYNNGDGTFTDIAVSAGVDVTGYGQGVSIADYNVDGWSDIFNAHPTKLFKNNGDMTFTDVTPTLFPEWASFTKVMGSIFFDYDNDGDLDLLVCEILPTYQVRFYRNDAQGTVFTEVTNAVGLSGKGSFSPVAFDFDHDGDLDLFLPDSQNGGHYLLENQAGIFVDVTSISGVENAPRESSGSSVADPDEDGDLDLLVTNRDSSGSVMLYRNDAAQGNWLILTLEGRTTNRSAFGTQVILRLGGITQLQELNSGHGHASQNEPLVHFGLGSATIVDEIEIRWLSGTVLFLHNVPVNQRIHVVEGGDLPDIEVRSLSVDYQGGYIGQTIPLRVSVRNISSHPAASVTISLHAGPTNGELQEVSECSVMDVGADQDKFCTFSWNTAGSSPGLIRLVATITSCIPGDMNSSNNSLEITYDLLPEPDVVALVVESLTIDPERPETPSNPGSVTLKATLWNMDSIPVSSGDLQFSYIDPDTSVETVIETQPFGQFASMERRQFTASLNTQSFDVSNTVVVKARAINLIPDPLDPDAVEGENQFYFTSGGSPDLPPEVWLLSPSSSPHVLYLEETSYTIVGVASDDWGISAVTINGIWLPLQPLGNSSALFEYEAPLPEKHNQFTIVVRDTGGHEVEMSIEIIRGIKIPVPSIGPWAVIILVLLLSTVIGIFSRRRTSRYACLLVIFIGSFPSSLKAFDWTWQEPVIVDWQTGAGTDFSAVEISPENVVHVLYYESQSRDLKHAIRLTPDEFFASSIIDGDGDCGNHLSLRKDNTGNLHLSYKCNFHLKYGFYQSGQWSFEIVDEEDHTGDYSSLRIDSAGSPVIAYLHVWSDTLRIATKTTKGWEKEDVCSCVGSLALALGPDDEERVFFLDYGVLKLAYRIGSVWQTITLDDSRVAIGRIAAEYLPADGSWHVVYYDNQFQLLHGKYQSTTFTSSLIASGGMDPALAVCPQGKLWLAYYDPIGDGVLRFGELTNSGFEEKYTTGGLGQHDEGRNPALAFSSANNVGIVERDSTLQHLEFIEGVAPLVPDLKAGSLVILLALLNMMFLAVLPKKISNKF